MTKALEIKISTTALTRLGSRYKRVIETFDTDLRKAQEKVGRRAERAYAAAARNAGYQNVARGVSATLRGKVVVITTEARNTEGYDYSLITRLGHKVARIYPKRRSVASVVATGRSRKQGHAAMLRFPYQGKILFRRSVAAWSPTHDWAEDADPEVQSIVHEEARKLGNVLSRKMTTK